MPDAGEPVPPVKRAVRLDPALSDYLDLLRVGAAAVVLLSHLATTMLGVPVGLIPGHEAVVVFFVISGYVIAYVADARDGSLGDYALNRLTRIWSVAIPAVVLVCIAAAMLRLKDASINAMGAENTASFLWETALNVFFIGESWGPDHFPPYNSAMWSLNFEAWYYAIYGAWIFLGRRIRGIAVVLLCLAAGPKILALMPCWLLGVALYRGRDRIRLGAGIALCLFLATIALCWLALRANLTDESRDLLHRMSGGRSYHLGVATSALGDWTLALLVTLNFLSVPFLPLLPRLLRWCRPAIRTAAAYTLSVYLYHLPLFAIFYGGLGLGHHGGLEAVATIVLVGAAAVLLGRVTELRRATFRAWLGAAARSRVPTPG